jgi:PTH1 family peptidyl-tRNA hydrolase
VFRCGGRDIPVAVFVPDDPRKGRPIVKLFVGLGNPGQKYARHRHNIGFMALERMATRHGFAPWRSKFQGRVTEGSLGGERVHLLMPETYMNESGRSVQEAARFLKLEDRDIVVFHDELDLTPGKVRVKLGGGNAGHNGLRSITACRSNDYQRVRLGIGHPGHKDLVHNWVLGDFAKADQVWLGDLLDAVADAAPFLAQSDPERFMTEVARLTGAPDPAPSTAAQKAAPPSRHPAGERIGKREAAKAKALEAWKRSRGET